LRQDHGKKRRLAYLFADEGAMGPFFIYNNSHRRRCGQVKDASNNLKSYMYASVDNKKSGKGFLVLKKYMAEV